MRAVSRAVLLLAGCAFLPCFAYAQAPEAAIVNQVSGEVTYAASGSPAARMQAFQRVRHGDRIALAAEGTLTLSYLASGHREAWVGPSIFVATSTGGELLKGSAPAVTQLPVRAKEKISRVPELIQMSRAGGVTIRAANRVQLPAGERNKQVSEAFVVYESLKKQTPPEDITADLFLYSVFEELSLYDDLQAVAKDLLERQPQNVELQSLYQLAVRRAQEAN